MSRTFHARSHRLRVASGRRALALSAFRTTESNEQQAVIQWANMLGLRQVPELARLLAIPNGGYRSKKTAGRLRAEGLRQGVPDLTLPIARRGFHAFWSELKTVAGATTPEQEQWLRWLRIAGNYTSVCLGADAERAALLWYLGQDATALCVEHAVQRVARPAYDLWVPASFTVGRKWTATRGLLAPTGEDHGEDETRAAH